MADYTAVPGSGSLGSIWVICVSEDSLTERAELPRDLNAGSQRDDPCVLDPVY